MNIVDPQHPEGEDDDHDHGREDGDQGNQLQLSRKKQIIIWSGELELTHEQ